MIITKLFSLETVYVLTGIVLFVFALLTWRDHQHPRRWGSTMFWLTLAIIFAFGSLLPPTLTGVLVILLVLLDGAGQVTKSTVREPAPLPLQSNRIFLPVLAIPIVMFAFALTFRAFGEYANRTVLVGLGVGSIMAMLLALRVTRCGPKELFNAGRQLNETMGAINILPQLLASLGVIFTAAKVGDLIANGITNIIPGNNLFLLVLANCVGMALLTLVMGNSFAAFPVIAAGVMVPLIIKPFGVDPALAAMLTLTAGSSGTLMTPMAANFNMLPAALLQMKNHFGVIRFQFPYALTLWFLHVLLLWGLALWLR